MQNSPWFIRRTPAHPHLRLYCFSYAGGSGTAYLGWQRRLPEGVELCAVQLPGRGSRMGEPLIANFSQLIQQLLHQLATESPLPFVFFGHSLGALVAFELTRLAKLHHLPQPAHLVVSGCEAPQFRSERKRLHNLADGPLIEALGAYNGTPRELMENKELMALALPVIRADFSLVADYNYRTAPRLAMPITVFEGRQDEQLDLTHVHEWQRETSAGCDVVWFEGGHFFINSASSDVQTELNRVLTSCL